LTTGDPTGYLIRVIQEIVIGAGESSKKLENFLAKRFPAGYVRKLFRKKGVRLNRKRANPDDLIAPGDRLQFYIPFAEDLESSRPNGPPQSNLEILFEDDQIIVINKPAGLAVHEAKGILRRHSLIGMLEARYRTRGVTPRLVHRLDKDTSGVLLAAKNAKTAQMLEALLAKEQVEKQYVCLLAGRLRQNEGRIDFPLPGRAGKPVRALTRFTVSQRFSETTLVRVQIETGRMHQIRLHFARTGHPVVMDEQHGDFAFNKKFRKAYGLRRQFLHASRITLEYYGKKRSWQAPLAADLAKTLERLALD
jgi:23S rRNA pseudouridine955/2504/2580 synthase